MGKKTQVKVTSPATTGADGVNSAPDVAMPQTDAEAAEVLRQLGAACRAVETERLRLTERVDKLQQAAAERVAPHVAKRDALFAALYGYARVNRARLTNGDKVKTVKLQTGSFCWRWSPQAADIANKERLVKYLKRAGLQRLITIKEDVMKKDLLADVELAVELPGVTISQQELFSAQPAEAEAELCTSTGLTNRVKPVGKGKLKLIASARSSQQGRRKKKAKKSA